MPSLWKKPKGNRISRLVADLQTTPKRGGSLVVETGFPTSLVDLFVKNRDKLKKPKTKKHKSKKLDIITEDIDVNVNVNVNVNGDVDVDVDVNGDGEILPPVSHPSVSFCKLELPRCSIVEDCEEIVAQIGKDVIFVEEIVENDKPVVELHHDPCENDNDEDEIRETMEVSNSKNVALLSMSIGVLVLIVVLYTKRWFLALITLGFLLLNLLEYIGNSCFGYFKPCENAISISILKGALVVVVALYTKWFVVGITIGASLLLLLEYAGNLSFGWFKPCHDVKSKLKGVLSHWFGSKRMRKGSFGERNGRKGGRGVLTRAILIGSKKEVHREGGFDFVSKTDFDQEGVGNRDIFRREIEPEIGSEFTSKRVNNLSFEDDGDVISMEEEIEEGSVVNEDSWSLENETRNRPMYEMLALELNYPISDIRGEKGTMEGGVKGSEDTIVANHNVKIKKSKKFWRNLVPKKMNKKKKYEHGREDDAAHIDGIQDTATELEEEDELESRELEISEVEESSTSFTEDETEGEIDHSSAGSCRYTEPFQTDDITTKSNGIVKAKDGNMKYLATLVIPLTGLIGGRMFAIVVTVICCLVFKMVRG